MNRCLQGTNRKDLRRALNEFVEQNPIHWKIVSVVEYKTNACMWWVCHFKPSQLWGGRGKKVSYLQYKSKTRAWEWNQFPGKSWTLNPKPQTLSPDPMASDVHQLSRTLSWTCTEAKGLKSPDLHPSLQSVLVSLQFQVVEVLVHPAKPLIASEMRLLRSVGATRH